MLILFYVFIAPLNTSPQPNNSSSGTDETIILDSDIITKIREKSLYELPLKKMMTNKSLKEYLRQQDPYSDYLSREEYNGFKASQKNNYAGVGMEIERNADGNIICFPYPDGTADSNGIKAGDILKGVNGINVSGKSVFLIGTMVRGEEGSEVRLEILDKMGNLRQLNLKRAAVQTESVVKKEIDNITVIQILYFNKSTQRELKYAFMNVNKQQPIVIDLRGNPGGDLHSAIDSTMLFFFKGKKIVDIVGKKATKSYKSTIKTLTINSGIPLYLWQDEMTASAAEVFIAALTQNKRAVSIGKRTYGKGTTQEIIELKDGTAVFLTTGYLHPPDGIRYDGKGIAPDYLIDLNAAETIDYMAKLKMVNKPSYSNTVGNLDTNSEKVNQIQNQTDKKGKFFIQFIVLSDKESALVSQSEFKDQLKNLGLHLDVFIKEVAGKYKIIIGGYEQKDDTLLNNLKQKQVVRHDAFWIQCD